MTGSGAKWGTAADTSISLPKGGGAIAGIGETFQPDPFSGGGQFSVPIATSPSRGGLHPELALQYSAGFGNGPFGLGWSLSLPQIRRKTEKGVPEYGRDDVFVLSGAEDLVPVLDPTGSQIEKRPFGDGQGEEYAITRYRPRTEGLFARIERWRQTESNDQTNVDAVHWRVTTKENVTSIYGRTLAGRIEGERGAAQTFAWLIEETFDAKGNHIAYEYAKDDGDLDINSFAEQNRTYRQRYLRRIYYGNIPQQDGAEPLSYEGETTPVGHARVGTDHREPLKNRTRRYAFEVLFDYGDLRLPDDHLRTYIHKPPIADNGIEIFVEAESDTSQRTVVPVRKDPFSNFRAGFELRTLRRCHGVLMVHHFAELGGPTLVKATRFHFDAENEEPEDQLSLLQGATLTGYRKKPDGSYHLPHSMPTVSFTYQKFEPGKQRYRPIAVKGDEYPSLSLGDRSMGLIDVFGDGLPDVVQSTKVGFRYWRNLGNGRFDRPKFMNDSPSGFGLGDPGVAIGDLSGDGKADLIVTQGAFSGFFEMSATGGWSQASFKHFHDSPSINTTDRRARLLDLTGDGLSDMLVTTAESFFCFWSLGEAGFDKEEVRVIPRKRDLDKFPDVYFDDPSGRVRLADMSGDGLIDIVYLHSGRIDYWPNLGHGKFGERLSMSAPLLPHHFDLARLFLVDLDGSGTSDLVYVEDGMVRYWLNLSGNGWSDERVIRGTPRVSGSTGLQFADLFGSGTATLIWSEPFGAIPGANYHAMDICGGRKPYLLVEMRNNLGATTRVDYASSTKFYLEDLENGEPWATSLPFPVHVIERVENVDHISGTKTSSFYRYRHGYFDGREREFRGFGRVDQIDAEQLFEDRSKRGMFDLPPVETRSWFHTGALIEENEIAEVFRDEFWKADKAAFATESNDLKLLNGDAKTRFEAVRALRGSDLRTELYGRDGSALANTPYSVTENCYQVRQIQARNPRVRNGVFLAIPKSIVTYQYEREASDPRISQTINLPVDESGHLTDAFGNITDSLSIAYARRKPDPEVPQQSNLDIVYTKQEVINRDRSEGGFYFAGVNAQSRSYEIKGLDWPRTDPRVPINAQDVATLLDDPDDFLSFEEPFGSSLQKKLIAWTRTYYREDAAAGDFDADDSAVGRLPFLEIDSLGLPYETYQASLTDDLMSDAFKEISPGQLGINVASLARDGGYVQLPESDGYWWLPAGRQKYDADCFYQATETRDPFGNIETRKLDHYSLLIESTIDPEDNRIEALYDYQTLQPFLVKDINDNFTEVALDPLGLVVGTAFMGKAGHPPSHTILGLDASGQATLISSLRTNSEGDNLEGFSFDPTPAAGSESEASRRQYFRSLITDPDGGHAAYSADGLRPALGQATSRIVYDLYAFADTGKPAVAAVIKREKHAAQSQAPPLQVSYSYSDGFGREVQSKLQAEPGGNNKRRWTVSGWTVFNNKGAPVQQFEPFFSNTPKFERDRRNGVTSTLFYDPLQRVVATILPDRSYEKVQFHAWQHTQFDASDTVLLDPRTDADVKGWVEGFLTSLGSDFQTWHEVRQASSDLRVQEAANKSAAHAETPATVHLDHRGRQVLAIARTRRDGTDEHLTTLTEYDVKGEVTGITDPRQLDANSTRPDGTKVQTFRYRYDLAGRQLQSISIDAGKRSAFLDVLGNPIRAFYANGRMIETRYDALRRPLEIWVKQEGTKHLAQRFTYGEESPNNTQNNRRGQIYRIQDGAGEIENERFDFEGNLETSTRRLPVSGDIQPDWQNAVPLEDDIYRTAREYDALNRVVSVTTPEGSITRPSYNAASLLETVAVSARGQSEKILVSAIDYNARGQRTRIEYGNGVETKYRYDSETFRLVETISTRQTDDTSVMHCDYVHDAVGNITSTRDHAAPTIHFSNAVVAPDADYTYDALHRLIEATGREHIGQAGPAQQDGPGANGRFGHIHPNDGQAMRSYRRVFSYDKAGNIGTVRHQADSGNWTRHYAYEAASNRLRSTSRPGDPTPDDPATLPDRYHHDANGNITAMPHLENMVWDHADRLIEVDLGGGGRAFYQYAGDGSRVRKTVVKGGVTEERLYLGAYEVFRKHSGGMLQRRRETLHVMDDHRRIAMIETLTHDSGTAIAAPSPTARYQLADQVESVSIELNEGGQMITYEIYYPYGGTAFHAARSSPGLSQKRYRFNGKERDEESGFYYYGARYYAPWLGRWLSCDPAGAVDGANLYCFVKGNPISFFDHSGFSSKDTNAQSSRIVGWSSENSTLLVSGESQYAVNVNEDLTITITKGLWATKVWAALTGEISESKAINGLELETKHGWIGLTRESARNLPVGGRLRAKGIENYQLSIPKPLSAMDDQGYQRRIEELDKEIKEIDREIAAKKSILENFHAANTPGFVKVFGIGPVVEKSTGAMADFYIPKEDESKAWYGTKVFFGTAAIIGLAPVIGLYFSAASSVDGFIGLTDTLNSGNGPGRYLTEEEAKKLRRQLKQNEAARPRQVKQNAAARANLLRLRNAQINNTAERSQDISRSTQGK